MVGVYKHLEGRAFSQAIAKRLKVLQCGERVAAALQEEHWEVDAVKVLGAVPRGLLRRVEGKGQKREPEDSWKGGQSLRLGSHASAERPPPRDEWQIGCKPLCFSDRAPNSGMCKRRRVRSLCTHFHERELIAQGRDPAFGKPYCDALH